jgi:hypothetical protein
MVETQTGRREFLRKAGMVTGGVAALSFGGLTGLAKAGAQGGSGGDTTQDIVNAALTAEQLATTFYYYGLLAAQLGQLPNVENMNNLNYFQAALWQEYEHATIFATVGGKSLAGPKPMFYFPNGVFEKQGLFFHVLDALETAFIGAYIAAIGEWAGDSPAAVSTVPSGFTAPQLAKIAGQFLGTESEHRALGRVANNENPPNNLILERAPYTQVGSPSNTNGTAVGTLLPFVTGGTGFEGPYAMPTKSEVINAAAPYVNLIMPGFAAP